jgi:serine/threonine protein kinase
LTPLPFVVALQGSYGSVYLCRHRKTGDEFACKVIGMNRINSHYLRKLHAEISIMKQVDHPNVIKVRAAPPCPCASHGEACTRR